MFVVGSAGVNELGRAQALDGGIRVGAGAVVDHPVYSVGSTLAADSD